MVTIDADNIDEIVLANEFVDIVNNWILEYQY